jgi:hypothetical protein
MISVQTVIGMKSIRNKLLPLAALALMLALAVTRSALGGPDTVVVCPGEFRQALAPWLELRRSQGHAIQLVSSEGTAEQIRERIRTVGGPPAIRSLLLVGGTGSSAASDALGRRPWIPAHYQTAKVVDRWGPEREIATDNWYADFDDDGVPDVAIGRLTVESADELRAVVKKIVAYEKQPDFHRWRSRVNFVAGASGFSPIVDALLETTARQIISAGIPAGYETKFTYANWRSPFCPDPRRFHETLIDRLNEGCLFWVYMGHGQRTGIARLRVPGGMVRCLDCGDADELHCACGSECSPPIALFFACYTGAFDSRQRCLADELLRADGGPVAIVAGSRTTMPYAMTVFGSELIDQCFREHAATLGEAILGAKRRLVGSVPGGMDSRRLVMDALAKAASPAGSDLAAERLEHVALFNLIGDPLLQLHFPQEIKITVRDSATAGEAVALSGKSPCRGRCTIELVMDQDDSYKPRSRFDSSADALSDYQRAYERSNHPPLCSTEMIVEPGDFNATLEIPPTVSGRCKLRAFVAGSNDCALGSTTIEVTSRPAAN